MSDEELQTIWRQSIDHYGKQLQSIVCMEECAELIQAISKKLRKDTSSNDVLAEEMADAKARLSATGWKPTVSSRRHVNAVG